MVLSSPTQSYLCLGVALILLLLTMSSECAPLINSHGTYIQVKVLMKNQSCLLIPSRPNATTDVDDERGAMCFAASVITIYGLSIAMLIGSTLKRNQTDYEVKGFLRSYAKLDSYHRRTEKDRMTQVLGRLHATLKTGPRIGREKPQRGTITKPWWKRRRFTKEVLKGHLLGMRATRALPSRMVQGEGRSIEESGIEEVAAVAVAAVWPSGPCELRGLLGHINLGPILLTWVISAWISNHMHSWDEITYQFPNFNGSTVEVWEWINNFITHFIMDDISYLCWD